MGEFIYFLAAMALTMVLMPPLIRLAGTAGFMDQPAPRKVHGVPMPRIGGLAITAGTFLPLLLWMPLDRFLVSYFAAALLLVLAGTWDDHREVDFRVKFAAQLAAALVMVSADGVLLERFEFETTVLLPGAFAYLLTVTFLVGVTNAINFADGLDGLAGGTTLLCVVALSGLAWMSGDAISLALGLTLCGSILGFLRFNTHPARVFMGDGGSQLLGFTAGVLAVRITQQEDSVFAVTLPLLLLGLPLVDALSVIVQRLFEGRSPFAADRNHVHHKLLHAGFDHHQSVVLIYLVQFALFVIAWLVRFEADHVVIGIFFAFAAIFVALLQLVRQREWRWSGSIAGSGGGGSQLSRWVTWLKLPARLPLWSRLLLGALVAAYAAIVILRSDRISPDLGILALVLLVPTTLLIPGRTGWLLVRMALFVAASLVVYLDETSAIAPLGSTLAYWLMFSAIALCTGISWRLAGLARFDITPLDWLVLFLAISLPVIASRWIGSGGLEAGIVKAVLLFYAIETLAQTGPSRSPWLRTAFGGLLAVMAARAILPFVTTMS